MTEEDFWNMIQYQRILGMAQVGVKLDQMCEDLGFERSWWRRERLTREWDLDWRARWVLGTPINSLTSYAKFTGHL